MNTMNSLSSLGYELATAPDQWGTLRESGEIGDNPEALRRRMEEDGYLFIRDFFPRQIIAEARLAILHRLEEQATFEGAVEDGVLAEGASLKGLNASEVRQTPEVRRVVFGPEVFGFYEQFLDHPIRAFDYVWLRNKGQGHGTPPHCDLVYMGRGTRRLYTAWIPYGDIPLDIGGLMILEGSHRQAPKLRNYLEMDVDTYCEGEPDRNGWKHGGHLTTNPVSLQEKLGGRWLSASFRMGDLLTFRMDTIHGSLDNRTRAVRLSTDTRYQRADEPADERWVGEEPAGHGAESKRPLIC